MSSLASGQGEWWSEALRAGCRTQHLGAAAAATGRMKWPERWQLRCSLLAFCTEQSSLRPAHRCAPGFASLAEAEAALFYLRKASSRHYKDHSSALSAVGFHLTGVGLYSFSFCLSALAARRIPSASVLV